IVSSQIDIADGGIAAPAEQWIWEALFDRSEVTRRSVGQVRREPTSKVTLAWLTQKIASVSAKERRDRFEMVRFAQAVFNHVQEGDEQSDVVIALSGYRRYRAILMTLDRMDITAPRVYARAVEAARRIDDELSGRDEKHAVVVFQAALAILERARLTREIDVA